MPETKQDIQIRNLNTKDFWNLLNIIRAGGKDAFSRMKDLDPDDKQAAGILLLDIGMEHAQKELSKFFADIAEMTTEEYEQSGFDTTLSILEQLEQREGIADFFNRAAKFIKKFYKGKN
jgi:hypothetical protein